MRRSALLVPVLLLSLTPAASAGTPACHGRGQYVETLTISLPAAPQTVRAGSTARVAATVTRQGVPAGDVMVYLRLLDETRDPGGYDSAMTTSDGRVALAAAVPRAARGTLRLTLEAVRPVAAVPCHGEIEEHGIVASDWGRAVR